MDFEIVEWVPADNPVFLGFWALCFASMIFFVQRRYSMISKLQDKIYIIDFWAAILSLLPTLLYFQFIFQRGGGPDRQHVARAILWGLSGLIGIWAGWRMSVPVLSGKLPSRWGKLGWVFGGGLFGQLGMIIPLLVLMTSAMGMHELLKMTAPVDIPFDWAGRRKRLERAARLKQAREKRRERLNKSADLLR